MLGEEGNLTIEASLIFPMYVLFFVMIVSILLYIYKQSDKSLRINNELEMKMFTAEIYEKSSIDLNENNEIYFKNIIQKLYSNLEEKEYIKESEIKKSDIIHEINKTDYMKEKIKEM